MPVVPSQSTLPHAHSAELGAEPSVTAQRGNWAHLLWDSQQYSPPAQSTAPHAQAELTSEPSVLVHTGGLEHLLDAAVQYMPVPRPSLLLVHAVFPQMQGPPLLWADPSVFVQSGAAITHMHFVQLLQYVVEAYVLNWLNKS
tara:strand:+ start:317 stop:742 length:426 start_codon:yes stop_codon:yes gene_type:complete